MGGNESYSQRSNRGPQGMRSLTHNNSRTGIGSISGRLSARSGGTRRSNKPPFSPRSDKSNNSRRSRKSLKSQKSKSSMTRDPLHFEQNVHYHDVPGINDKQSPLYREFDAQGRAKESFFQRATLTGIKNLETGVLKKDTPVHQTQSRFPEKYEDTSVPGQNLVNLKNSYRSSKSP